MPIWVRRHRFCAVCRFSNYLGSSAHLVILSSSFVRARPVNRSRWAVSNPVSFANLVILDRDPVTDLDNLKSVVMTVKRGRIFNRSAFVPLQQDDITDR